MTTSSLSLSSPRCTVGRHGLDGAVQEGGLDPSEDGRVGVSQIDMDFRLLSPGWGESWFSW